MSRFALLLAFSWILPLSLADGGGSSKVKDDNHRYVLSYGEGVTLDDVESVVRLLGAKVERPLTCTRGIIVSTDGKAVLDDDDPVLGGFNLLPITDTHPHFAQVDEKDWRFSQGERRLRKKHRRHRRRQVRNNFQRQRTNALTGGRRHEGPGQRQERPNGQRRPRPSPRPCECTSFGDVYENQALSEVDATTLKDAIIANIELESESYAGSKTDSIGELLRLVFHDIAPFDVNNNDASNLSGLNGCVDLAFPSNFGLQSAIDFLLRLRRDKGIVTSMADLFVLGAIAAVEAAGGPQISFQYGRADIPCRCESNFFPDPESPEAQTTAELDKSMRDRLGLTRREITALLGSHTVGRLEVDNSGYEGGWIPPAERSNFTNLYYVVMIDRPWVKTTKEIQGRVLTEWRSPKVEIDAMMLNIDAILAFDIKNCNVFGDDPLNFLGTGSLEGGPAEFVPTAIVNCTRRNDEYGTAVAEFAKDNDSWIDAYVLAFTKMVETTFPCGDLRSPL